MKKLIILIAIATSFYSCKEDKKDPEPTKTRTEYLTAKRWIQTGFTVDPGIDENGTIITDWWTQLEPCSKDDTYKFGMGGIGDQDEGATKCDSNDPQSFPFTWSISSDEKILTFRNDKMDILQLDENVLKISFIIEGELIGGVPGVKYKVIWTYGHQ